VQRLFRARSRAGASRDDPSGKNRTDSIFVIISVESQIKIKIKNRDRLDYLHSVTQKSKIGTDSIIYIQ
jgi:hypothetical protein